MPQQNILEIDDQTLATINTRIIEGETSQIEDCEGVGYMLNLILEVLPSQVRSVTFQGVTVSRDGTEDWTFRRALRYITNNYL